MIPWLACHQRGTGWLAGNEDDSTISLTESIPATFARSAAHTQ